MKTSLSCIMEEYHANDICMAELLASIPADGLTMEEAFELYIAAKKWADGDKFYQITDSGKQELPIGNMKIVKG